MKRTTLILIILIGLSTFTASITYSQNQAYLIEFNSNTRIDSAIIYVEKYIAEGKICSTDSIHKKYLYKVLDDLKLYSYGIRLIEQDLQCMSINSNENTFDLLTKKAFFFYKNSQLSSAKNQFIKNLNYIDDNDLLRTINFGGLAFTYFDLMELDSALYYSIKFEKSALQGEDSSLIAEAIKLKANIFFQKSEYDKSYQFHTEAIPYCDSFLLANTYNEIGRDLHYLGKLDESYNYLQKSIILKEKLNDYYGMCASIGNMGHLFLSTQNNIKAFECFEESLLIAQEHGFTDLESWMYKSMSDYFSGNKNYERGLFYYCKYHELATILANQNSDIRFMVERAKANALIQRRDYDILKRENQINKLQNTRYILIIITIILISALSIIGLVFLRFRSQKKNLQLKLKLKRAQINPHFIFNSLNIVQAKILEGNNFESNTYLTKFSKIVRFILENSTNNYNSLAQELEFLSSYIEMEKIRFENDLSVIIDIDNSLSTNKVWIPSLIIQPFVENAIWHGLQPKEDAPWVIKIIFEIKNKYLLIKIDDNGIGINKSIEQKQHGFKSHKKSMGLQLSKERIQTLKQIYHKNYSIEIIDKSTTSNEAGTIVTITIPINYKNERIY